MNKKEIKLLKEYVLMTDKEQQGYADTKCIFCRIYMNKKEGEEPCKFQNICGYSHSELRKKLSKIIDEILS